MPTTDAPPTKKTTLDNHAEQFVLLPDAIAQLNRKRDAFTGHLDICDRCRNQPFDLCPVGHEILTGEKP